MQCLHWLYTVVLHTLGFRLVQTFMVSTGWTLTAVVILCRFASEWNRETAMKFSADFHVSLRINSVMLQFFICLTLLFLLWTESAVMSTRVFLQDGFQCVWRTAATQSCVLRYLLTNGSNPGAASQEIQGKSQNKHSSCWWWIFSWVFVTDETTSSRLRGEMTWAIFHPQSVRGRDASVRSPLRHTELLRRITTE